MTLQKLFPRRGWSTQERVQMIHKGHAGRFIEISWPFHLMFRYAVPHVHRNTGHGFKIVVVVLMRWGRRRVCHRGVISIPPTSSPSPTKAHNLAGSVLEMWLSTEDRFWKLIIKMPQTKFSLCKTSNEIYMTHLKNTEQHSKETRLHLRIQRYQASRK